MKKRKKTALKIFLAVILLLYLATTQIIKINSGGNDQNIESYSLNVQEEPTQEETTEEESADVQTADTETSTEEPTVLCGYVNISETTVYEEPNYSGYGGDVGEVTLGDVVEIMGEDDTKTFYDTEYGWIEEEYITIPEKDPEIYELKSAMIVSKEGSDENRKYNLALASSKINGLTLKPGEQFDWFEVVGQANEANGYKQATVISGGQYVLGYGGGICQVSTTLYNCIYKLDIEPDEIYHHSIPATYVDLGMDATIAYSSGKNFKFTNTKDYTLEFDAFSEGGTTTVLAFEVKE